MFFYYLQNKQNSLVDYKSAKWIINNDSIDLNDLYGVAFLNHSVSAE